MQSTDYYLRPTNTSNLFAPRPNLNFMKRTLHYSGNIWWNVFITFKLEDGKKCKHLQKEKKCTEYLYNYNKSMIKYILIYHIKHVVCTCFGDRKENPQSSTNLLFFRQDY